MGRDPISEPLFSSRKCRFSSAFRMDFNLVLVLNCEVKLYDRNLTNVATLIMSVELEILVQLSIFFPKWMTRDVRQIT